MILKKLINLTGCLFRTNRLRAAVVAILPVWLFLPFAQDLARQLPPLTVKVYAAADGNLYIHPPVDATAMTSPEPEADVMASTTQNHGDLTDTEYTEQESDRLALDSATRNVEHGHTLNPLITNPMANVEKELLQFSDTAGSGNKRPNSLWRTQHYPATNLVDLMRDYAFTSQLNAVSPQHSISQNGSIKLQELPENEIHTAFSGSTGFVEQGDHARPASDNTPDAFLSSGFFGVQRIKPRHVVMLDPGHGGSDPGTIGAGGMLEKEITLDIAKRVQVLARQRGDIEVLLTRTDDAGFARAQRVSIVKRHKPDLLLSLHLNNLPQKDLNLVETFYAGHENILESMLSGKKIRAIKTSAHASQTTQRAAASKKIAGYLQNFIYDTVSANNQSAVNAGIKKDTLFMLTRSEVPGALIELSCLSNAEEEKRLETTRYRDELARSLLRAMEAYFDDFSELPSA